MNSSKIEDSTSSVKLLGGVPCTIPNVITKNDKNSGFYVSYNNRSLSDYGCKTTALYIKETAQYLILNGNHTLNYKDCTDLKSHLFYFYSKIEEANHRSEHGIVFDITGYKKGGY